MLTDRRIVLTAVVAALAVLALVSCGQPSEQATSPTPSVEAGTTTVASSAKVEDAIAFWEALAAGDREAALGLVDPAGLKNPPFGRAFTLEGQFDWYEAVGWNWTLEECGRARTATVECTATAQNAWSDSLEVDPVTGTFVVRFGTNGITYVTEKNESFSSQWHPLVFDIFADWVATNHPADAEVMFEFWVDVNPEILDLYAVNTRRFVEAQEGK
jgi:hypothetical protein